MKKGLIEQIGTVVDVDGKAFATGWIISETNVTIAYRGAILYRTSDDTVCGYTEEELRQIAHARDLLSMRDKITLDEPLIIPAGRYAEGVFVL